MKLLITFMPLPVHIKLAIEITVGWWDITKTIGYSKDEPNHTIEEDNSGYNLDYDITVI